MRRIYYFLFSVILNIVCTPPIWASGTIAANNSNDASTTTDAQVTNALWQDTNPKGPNYLDRRHALVGANCMVNRVGSSLAKVISGTSNLDNLVDKDLTNYVSTASVVNANVALEPSFSIKDLKHTYAKGTTAGFVIGMSSNSLLNLKLIGLPYQIWFYKNGKRVDRVNCNEKSGSLLNLKLLQVSGSDITCEVTASTKKDDFDEIAICYTGGVKADVLSNSKIYYAFVGKNGRYFLSNEKPGLAELKAKYNNNNLTLAHDGNSGENLLDNDSTNRYVLTNSEKTVMLYDNTITSLSNQVTIQLGGA